MLFSHLSSIRNSVILYCNQNDWCVSSFFFQIYCKQKQLRLGNISAVSVYKISKTSRGVELRCSEVSDLLVSVGYTCYDTLVACLFLRLAEVELEPKLITTVSPLKGVWGLGSII